MSNYDGTGHDALRRASRRAFLGAIAGSATAGFMAGAAAGAALGYRASPPPPVVDGPKRFAGKVVLVTGGTSGIGRASVIAFADAGADVVFCGRREARGREVEREAAPRGGSARFVRADVRDPEQVRALVDGIVQRHGRLDVAFNNAGIYGNRPFHEMPLAEFDDIQATNVRGTFLCMQAQLPVMLAQGGGTIIVTSSVQELATRPGSVAYAASKRALVALVKVAALEYGARGIRVNAICPGTIDTPMVRQGAAATLPDPAWGIASRQWAKDNVPGVQRMGTPEEIARAVLWMASDEMSYLNGAAVVVDGGMTTAL